MFLPHKKKGEQFIPLTSSVDAARLLSYISRQRRGTAQSGTSTTGTGCFSYVEELLYRATTSTRKKRSLDQLCRIMIGREERMLDLGKTIFVPRRSP